MTDAEPHPFDDPTGETYAVLHSMSAWEAALHAVSRLAVVFALSLALILILGHQMTQHL
jgi:energy-converting hydrogenase Eha subunit F